MNIQKKTIVLAISAAMMGIVPVAQAAEDTDQDQVVEQLQFTEAQNLSNKQVPDLGMAFKTKLVRLGNGALITVFGDGANSTNSVYDVKGDNERSPRDIFIRTCDSVNANCELETSWSAPENVSGTAGLTSITTDWQGDNGEPSPYYGDSDKPNISNGGSNIMVTWVDKYCGAEDSDQRTVTYITRENREIPFSCTYARYATVAGSGAITWGTEPIQLSDGSRDAKQDVSKVNSMGKAVITWQEDPQGLQLGSADGPGDGASGAIASHGTDIWYTTAESVVTKFDTDGTTPIAGKVNSLYPIARFTNNTTGSMAGDNRVVRNAAGELVSADVIDGGQTASTRANTGLFDNQLIVAYEETKGSEEIEYGKYVRYHAVPYTINPAETTNQVGCIISNPAENARRVRFVAQSKNTVGKTSDMVMAIFWKEGQYDQGGPSDIMLRLARNDSFATANMSPAVDANCEAATYEAGVAVNNAPALNLSSRTGQGGSFADTTETYQNENSLAHRGAIVRDTVFIGYSYTGDWITESLGTDANYDFWVRTYDAAGDTWTNPSNVSRLPTTDLNVREPRIVKTPYSEDGTYNPDAFVIAWGTQTNVDYFGEAEELEIFYTRTFDKGATYEPIARVANPAGAARFESQLRPTPSAEEVYLVWNEDSGSAVDSVLSKGTAGTGTGEDVYDTSWYSDFEDTTDATVTASSSSGGSAGVFDNLLLPALIGLLMGAIGFMGLRRAQGNAQK